MESSNQTIRILLADDQRLMLDGLRIQLEQAEDMNVVGLAEDGLAAIEAYEQYRPDVVLMDVRMPRLNGVEATRRICDRWPSARVIILTTFDHDAYIFEGLRAGARGYLLKAMSRTELIEAVRTVAAGGSIMEPAVARKVMQEFARLAEPQRASEADLVEPLSEREMEVLQLLAQGHTNREISQVLHLAHGTVKNYVTMILNKLGARDRTEAALRARELGLLNQNF
ncbi:response regulator transcription factor [Chloroflexi bacterium TSY]|nr:response regulator transcription factor [Chloroflexi bacterium TSY]